MGMFLNNIECAKNFQRMTAERYFIDKSALLSELILYLGRTDRYVCITRPRRFGKTVMANMIASYFGIGMNSAFVFDSLHISSDTRYLQHLNKHHVIYIDFSRLSEDTFDFQQYMSRIFDGIKADLIRYFPEDPNLQDEQNLYFSKDPTQKAVWDFLSEIYRRTGHTFIFVIDEWDSIFHLPFVGEREKENYLLYMKSLLKDQAYVEFVYMTGVLPISNYTVGSQLNMFDEYDMSKTEKFSDYFGFTSQEVDTLYQRYQKAESNPKVKREELTAWYDGYHTASGHRLYNPRSIVSALRKNQIANYWTSSGPFDEIYYYIQNDILEIRDDLVLMISGEGIDISIQYYTAAAMHLTSKDEIYSAMVVYGLLTYQDGKVFIPNREIMQLYQRLLMKHTDLDYVHRLAKVSEKMLKATLHQDTETMASILQYAHDTESPIFSYNSEIELSAVVNLVYLAARDWYHVEREDKAGKGFVDFIFYPRKKGIPSILLELKIDATADEAIRQIQNKNYMLRIQGKIAEKREFDNTVLLVGLSYSKKTKKHACKVISTNLEDVF